MTNKKNNKQGFNEDADPLLGKAKKHSIVAQKTKFQKENVSKKSAIAPVPDAEDIITLRFDNSEDQFADLAEKFENDNDIELVIRKEEEDIFVDIPVEHSADFIDFMAENDIKVKEEKEAVEDAKKTEETDDNALKVDDAKKTEKVCDPCVQVTTEVDVETQISCLKCPVEAE